MVSVHLLVQCLIVVAVLLLIEVSHADVAKSGCNDTCGGVRIPFPFGMGEGCFYDEWFKIECKPDPSNYSNVKPLLSKFSLEVMEIGLDSRVEDLSSLPYLRVGIAPVNSCRIDADHPQHIDLKESPFEFSRHENIFVMEGCPDSASLVNQSKEVMAECAAVCNSSNIEMHTNNCNGINCCQASLPSPSYYDSYTPFQFYRIEFGTQSAGAIQGNCTWASLMESQYVERMSSSEPASRVVPIVLLWRLPIIDQPDGPNGPHAHCYHNYYNISLCACRGGYYGNPYIPNIGCQVTKECKGCRGQCLGEWDMEGRLTSTITPLCFEDPVLSLAAILGLSISLGIFLLVVGVYGLYRFIKWRREIRRRSKFFKRNGGLLLQQQLSSNEGVVERTKVFSINELDKATDHFHENRILGQGGQGTVYKGMLSDGRIVAIKKAKLLDESQLEQFINEVVILSQINHRNVVKLLGCCLETEIPLLVYEFVPNGTLFQHIHEPDEDFVINWEMCLKIAADSAAAVAYLHSSASIPIYHRDIKSANILLDEKHKAKVSDFGSSRTIAIDQTHMTTLVQGTMGYLDPEYFHSYQFTEKSDVYSFGVVLLELLTGKKPIYRDAISMEQKNLVTEFLFQIQNSRSSDILDPKVVRDAKEEELMSIVELTKRCISWSGKLRPTMKEVAMTLEMIIKSPDQVSRWYQGQEPFPISEGGFDEYAMEDISDTMFFSSTALANSSGLPNNDVHPLLPDTK